MLNNIASALGLDGKKPGVNPEANYDKPITAEDAKKVMDALTNKNSDLNRAVTLRDLQALAVAGLDFTGNAGSTHRALGTTLSIKGKSDVTTYDENVYTSDNVATNVKADGTVEIGFKKSPTFDDVKAKNIEALNGKFENLKVKEKIETKEIVFKTATGNNVTIATGKDGNLYINGVAVPTAETAPVIYTNETGERVELGQDGKVYKPEDLKNLTYVAAKEAVGNQGDPNYVPAVTAGYYSDNKFEKENDGVTFKQDSEGNKILIKGETPENLTSKEYKGEVLHKLSPLSKTDTNARRLVNVAAGKSETDAVNVKQLNDSKITFSGDTGTAKDVKLNGSLAIKGSDTISTEMTDEGLVIKVKEGKVDAPKIADQAVTSAKLAKDARTVVYVDANNNPVELGADGKLYKSEDLKNKTYIVSKDPTKTGYYNNDDLNPEKTAPLDGKDKVTLVEATPKKHALNGYVAGGTDVTTNSVLTNVGKGTISETSTDAINGSQIKSVLDKLGVTTDENGNPLAPEITGLTKADGSTDVPKTTLKDGLNAVIAKVNEGIKYNGDLGTEETQQLGTVFNVNRATKGTPLTETVTGTTINYVGDNLITKYTKNTDGSGKLEIGFKESPTFKEVTATDKITTPELVLKGKDKSADVKLTRWKS